MNPTAQASDGADLKKTDQSLNPDVDFMSMLSHQLSTPLGTVRWYAELLRTGKMTAPLDSGQADMVNEIQMGVDRMTALLNDIHDCSWLVQDKFTDEQIAVSLADLVSTAQNQYQADITAKGLTFTIESSPTAPTVFGRPSIMTIIVQNLVSNAVKYTPQGGTVQVEVRQATDDEVARAGIEAGGGVLLSVKDSGYGIPKDQQDRVFSRFFRADNVSALGIDGTGLGLYITATATSRLGGGIWFESEDGHGTAMYVALPVNTRP